MASRCWQSPGPAWIRICELGREGGDGLALDRSRVIEMPDRILIIVRDADETQFRMLAEHGWRQEITRLHAASGRHLRQ